MGKKYIEKGRRDAPSLISPLTSFGEICIKLLHLLYKQAERNFLKVGYKDDRRDNFSRNPGCCGLEHQNICSIHEIDEVENQIFMVISYVDIINY